MFDDPVFDATFTSNFQTAMAASSGISTDDIAIISKYQGSVSINSQVLFSWDDISTATSFQTTLASSVATIFVTRLFSADFWSQCGSTEAILRRDQDCCLPAPAIPSAPPPPPDPTPFGIIHVESTIDFSPRDPATFADEAQRDAFLEEYVRTIAAAAGVDPEFVNITLVIPIYATQPQLPPPPPLMPPPSRNSSIGAVYSTPDEDLWTSYPSNHSLPPLTPPPPQNGSSGFHFGRRLIRCKPRRHHPPPPPPPQIIGLSVIATVEFAWTDMLEADTFQVSLVNHTDAVFDSANNIYWATFEPPLVTEAEVVPLPVSPPPPSPPPCPPSPPAPSLPPGGIVLVDAVMAFPGVNLTALLANSTLAAALEDHLMAVFSRAAGVPSSQVSISFNTTAPEGISVTDTGDDEIQAARHNVTWYAIALVTFDWDDLDKAEAFEELLEGSDEHIDGNASAAVNATGAVAHNRSSADNLSSAADTSSTSSVFADDLFWVTLALEPPEVLGATTTPIQIPPALAPSPHPDVAPPCPHRSPFSPSPSPPPPPPSPPPVGVIRVESVIGFSDLEYYRFQSASFGSTFRAEFTAAMIAGAGVAGSGCEVTHITQGLTRITSTTFLPWDFPAEAAVFAERVRRNVRTVFAGSFWEEFGMPVTFQVGDVQALGAALIPPPPPSPPPGGVHVVETRIRFPLLDVAALDSPGSQADFEATFAAAMAAAAAVPAKAVTVSGISAGSTIVMSGVTFEWTHQAEAMTFTRTVEGNPGAIFQGVYWEPFGTPLTLSSSTSAYERTTPAAPPPPQPLPPPHSPPMQLMPPSPSPPGRILDSAFGGGGGILPGVGGGVGEDGDLSVIARQPPQFLDGSPAVGTVGGETFQLSVEMDTPAIVYYVVEAADRAASAVVAYVVAAEHRLELPGWLGDASGGGNSSAAALVAAFQESLAAVCGVRAANVTVALGGGSAPAGHADSNASAAPSGHAGVQAASDDATGATTATSWFVSMESRVRVDDGTAVAAEEAGMLLAEASASGALLREVRARVTGADEVHNVSLVEWRVTGTAREDVLMAAGSAATSNGSALIAGNISYHYGEEVVVVLGLQSETPYSVYVLAVEPSTAALQATGAPLLRSSVAALELRTADITPPSFASGGYPRITGIRADRVAFVVALTEPGRVYYNVKETPSALHVMLGVTPAAAVASVVKVPAAFEAVTVEVAGLNSESQYTIHLLAEDSATPPNWQAEPSQLQATTLDITPPSIQLHGAASLRIEQQSVYDDLGASAYDTFDGDISHMVRAAGDVDMATLGRYEITYTVADAAGNVATATREIVVVTALPPSPYMPAQPLTPPPVPGHPISSDTQATSRPAYASSALNPTLAQPKSAPTLPHEAARAPLVAMDHISEDAYYQSPAAHRVQATSSLHGFALSTTSSATWINASFMDAFASAVGVVCAVAPDAVHVRRSSGVGLNGAPGRGGDGDIPPSALPPPNGPAAPYLLPVDDATSSNGSHSGAILTDSPASNSSLPGGNNTGTIAHVEYIVDAYSEANAEAVAACLVRTSETGALAQELGEGLGVLQGDVVVDAMTTEAEAEAAVRFALQLNALVELAEDDPAAAVARATTVLQGEAFAAELAAQAGATLYSVDVSLGQLRAPIVPPRPPPPPLFPPAAPLELLRVTARVDMGHPTWSGAVPPPTTSGDSSLGSAFQTALLQDIAEAASPNNPIAIIEWVSTDFRVESAVQLRSVATWAATENAAFAAAVAEVCGDSVSAANVSVTVTEVPVPITTLAPSVTSEDARGPPLVWDDDDVARWTSVEYDVAAAGAEQAAQCADALRVGEASGSLLWEVQRHGLPEVQHLEVTEGGGGARAWGEVEFILGAVDAAAVLTTLNATSPWLRILEAVPESARVPPLPFPPGGEEGGGLWLVGPRATQDDGGAQKEHWVMWVAGFGAMAVLAGGLALLVRRYQLRTDMAKGGMAAAAAHAAELEGDGWSPESAALGGRLQMALDARSPGEWHLERVLSEPQPAGGDGNVMVCVVQAYSRLIKATAIKVVAAEIRRKLSKDHQSALGREAAAMQRTRSQHVRWRRRWRPRAGGCRRTAVRIAVNVLRGLEAVHAQSLVHRDVKPGNIMVQGDSEVKLIDFGIAVLDTSTASFSGSTREATIMLSKTYLHAQAGTPHYMPLEQWEGDAVDQRADIFALGVTLFQALTGIFPFANGSSDSADILQALGGRTELPDPRAVAPRGVHVSDSVGRTVAKALFKSKSKRWSSAAAMRRELQRSLLLGNTDTFHVFLSYRVRTEAWFVELLYEALRKRRVEAGQGTHTQVFWDKMCLQNGQPWEEGFMIGLTSSVVVVPVISLGSTKPLTSVNAWVDNVLLEWMTAQALLNAPAALATNVCGIFPVFLGQRQDPPSAVSLETNEHPGVWCTDFFTDGSDGGEKGAAYPEEPAPATCAKMVQHLRQLDWKIELTKSGTSKRTALGRAPSFKRSRSSMNSTDASDGEAGLDVTTSGNISNEWLQTQQQSIAKTMTDLKQMEGFVAHEHSGVELVDRCATAIIEAVDKALAARNSSRNAKTKLLPAAPEAACLTDCTQIDGPAK
ncbi:hypothetical protein CYMTET_11769 [Cymbomonas tetramitiformis]|uniref:Protein kinase domain-containing protein n=1 Tax=Cymbomonas tetramitiformis TaxID=36881 RepID=A0AAE0LD48_9CHLO|nr:hypothetical protein CYMTET_11769 [Cymbomonas tetramitiformis]